MEQESAEVVIQKPSQGTIPLLKVFGVTFAEKTTNWAAALYLRGCATEFVACAVRYSLVVGSPVVEEGEHPGQISET